MTIEDGTSGTPHMGYSTFSRGVLILMVKIMRRDIETPNMASMLNHQFPTFKDYKAFTLIHHLTVRRKGAAGDF